MRQDTSVPILVIGAGPAGLMAAAAAGKKALLVERNPRPGRKLLLSGSGRCNITHTGEVDDFIRRYGCNGKFLRPALRSFPPEALLDFFKTRGLDFLVREDGKIFPATLKAGDVLRRLVEEVGEDRIMERTRVIGAERIPRGFLVRIASAEMEETILAAKLVLATGGLSYPGTGSTGDGYDFARALGHSVVEPRPALTGVLSPGFRDLAGNSFSLVEVSLYREGKRIASARGDFLFTHRGVSGPAVLDLSRSIEKGDLLTVDFLHPEKPEDVADRLRLECRTRARERTTSYLASPPVTRALAEHILGAGGIPGEKKLGDLNRREMRYLSDSLSRFPVPVRELEGFDSAMTTAGGVALNEVNPKTMESRLVPGLYFAGEVLDVDGDSGGYNLQAAFSTGRLAGKSAAS